MGGSTMNTEANRNAPKMVGQQKVFGLENNYNHLNCFLNVILQAFWNLESFQMKMITYACDEKVSGGKIEGFIKELKSLILKMNASRH